MTYKRGKVYWYKFMWQGKLIRESTKQGNDGATPAVVQKQMRHSDPRITLGIYGHVIGDEQRNVVQNRPARLVH